jgi:hypothetical protein
MSIIIISHFKGLCTVAYAKIVPYAPIRILADIYTRYATSKDVAAFLNGPEAQTAARQEVVNLVENLNVAREWQPAAGTKALRFPQDFPAAFREINAIVDRSPIRYQAWFDLSKRRFEWKEKPLLSLSGPDRWIHIVLNLDVRGKLSVRHCKQCNKWFGARRHDGKYCNPMCKQKDFRSTPKFKKRWAAKMREYRKKAGKSGR